MKNIYLIIIIGFLFMGFKTNSIPSNSVSEMEMSLCDQTWIYENTTYIMSDDKDEGSLFFKCKDHTYSFKGSSESADLIRMEALGTGKWKIITSNNIEFFLVLKNKDTLGIEFGIDSKLWKETLILTQKSKTLENPSFLNIFYQK